MHEQNCASDIETLTIAASTTSNGASTLDYFMEPVQVRCRSTLTAKSYNMHDDGFRRCGLKSAVATGSISTIRGGPMTQLCSRGLAAWWMLMEQQASLVI